MSEQAIIIKANGEISEVLLPAEGDEGRLESMQKAVGGLIERFPSSFGMIYLNEEGWIHQLPMNVALMALINANVPLLGDALILPEDEHTPIHPTLKRNLQLLMNEQSEYTFFEGDGEE